MNDVTAHHPYCQWFFEQYDSDCDCGAVRPKAVWFDQYVRECDEAREAAGITPGGKRERGSRGFE
jgi:hypothetical protein